jgi:hypothetical protein
MDLIRLPVLELLTSASARTATPVLSGRVLLKAYAKLCTPNHWFGFDPLFARFSKVAGRAEWPGR